MKIVIGVNSKEIKKNSPGSLQGCCGLLFLLRRSRHIPVPDKEVVKGKTVPEHLTDREPRIGLYEFVQQGLVGVADPDVYLSVLLNHRSDC